MDFKGSMCLFCFLIQSFYVQLSYQYWKIKNYFKSVETARIPQQILDKYFSSSFKGTHGMWFHLTACTQVTL